MPKKQEQVIEPPVDLELFENEQANNQRLFKEMVRNLRPDIFVLMDLLDQTGVNYLVLFQVIRQLNNIALGNQWGEVKILIENGIVKFVNGEERARLEEPILIKK